MQLSKEFVTGCQPSVTRLAQIQGAALSVGDPLCLMRTSLIAKYDKIQANQEANSPSLLVNPGG